MPTIQKMLVLLFVLIGLAQSQTGCQDGWTESNGYCYKIFDTPKARVNFIKARYMCQKLGGDIATGATAAERELMFKLGNGMPEHMLIGVILAPNGTWVSVDPTEQVDNQFKWCKGPSAIEPDVVERDHCTFMCQNIPQHVQAKCLCNGDCDYTYRRYMCRKRNVSQDTLANGVKCVCKQ